MNFNLKRYFTVGIIAACLITPIQAKLQSDDILINGGTVDYLSTTSNRTTITVATMTNGTIDVATKNGTAGQTISFTVKPNQNYRLKSGTLYYVSEGKKYYLPDDATSLTIPSSWTDWGQRCYSVPEYGEVCTPTTESYSYSCNCHKETQCGMTSACGGGVCGKEHYNCDYNVQVCDTCTGTRTGQSCSTGVVGSSTECERVQTTYYASNVEIHAEFELDVANVSITNYKETFNGMYMFENITSTNLTINKTYNSVTYPITFSGFTIAKLMR